ncbi:MAG: hypothetical protein WA691_01480 [Thermoplasmata archaeon]
MPSHLPQRDHGASRRGRLGALSVVLLLLALALLGTTLTGIGSANAAPPTSSLARPVMGAQPPPGEYWVNFTETGLPGGTSWGVTYCGTDSGPMTGEITFFGSPPGCTYTVDSVTGYSASPNSGTVTVPGPGNGNQTIPITFTPISYQLQFSESGLPFGTTWWANLTSPTAETMSAVAPGDVDYSLPDGTYHYTIASDDPAYSTSQTPGSTTIFGGPDPVSITFTISEFSETFNEQNLPGGTKWAVTVSGESPVDSTTTSLVVTGLVDGSYTYTVQSFNTSWYNDGGGFTISGGDGSQNVVFEEKAYTVEFSESGLIPSTEWSVTFDGMNLPSTSATIAFDNIPNGTYGFAVGQISGYYDTPSSGSITVHGGDVIQPVTFSRAVYNVTFNESGLTGSTKWWVNLTSGPTGVTSHPGNSGLGTTIILSLPNGTYTYTVQSDDKRWEPTTASGGFTVNGAALVFPVTFTELVYAVTFTAAALPPGLQWWVNITAGGLTNNTTGSTITYQLANGSYEYHASSALREWAAPSGLANVTGGPLGVTVTFTDHLYPVTFNETGLSPGTAWSINVSGTVNTTTGAAMTFNEPNGTASWVVSYLAGYTTRDTYGNVTVRGIPLYVTITFKGVAFPVKFTETGIVETGTPIVWWVNVTYQNLTLYAAYEFSATAGFAYLSNGTWVYTVQTDDKALAPTIPTDTIVVDGAELNITVTFLASTYPVEFVETGLPSGALWSVTVMSTAIGATPISLDSTSTFLTFNLQNGTYQYRVPPNGIYFPTPGNGSVLVNGGGAMLSIAFVRAEFTVTFYETGLASGTLWSVTLDGITETSTNSTVVFSVVNGTFPFEVSSTAGPTPNPSSGWVYISGASSSMTVTFGATGQSGLGLSELQLAILAGLIVAAAILLVAVVLSRRSRRPPPTEFTPPAGATSEGTPAEATSPADPASASDAAP